MDNSNHFNFASHITAAYEYLLDAGQRAILFMDIMRKRGNIYLDHINNGQPPVLTFPDEIILHGRDLERPVNFSLSRILDRREYDSFNNTEYTEKRKNPVNSNFNDPKKRPIIIIDPRAGHGPGIGGSKRDSEIGMSINEGHPVYFFIFGPNPVPGQTLTDVHNAQIRFIEEVIRRHPEAEKPAIIGNCQAGWAAALIGADRPDITGPLVFNGSPLSYWAGVEGKNPMRYRGGLYGGVWLTSFWSDLGNGFFDGAHLVAGFEDLNPANTLWDKQYHLYSHVDTEENRYLEFERWWNGYFMLTREEMHYIIENLFVGNKLEKGQLDIEGRRIDLKNLKNPVLIFASSGDNITPPQQALNWIYNVWGSVAEIKRHQQVIVYLRHDTIGHLGIFVSGNISKKQHKEIIASIDLIEYLSPGLYEMVIDESKTPGEFSVRFESRNMNDILALDDGLADEENFIPAAAFSEFNDRVYQNYISPWVRLAVNEALAELIRQLHPMRVSRYMFSDINPWMQPFKYLAPDVKMNRKPVSPDNPYAAIEKSISQTISYNLDLYRDIRDLGNEFLFKSIYANPWFNQLFQEPIKAGKTDDEIACQAEWQDEISKGGLAEGVVRIMVAAASVNKSMQRSILKGYDQIVTADERLSGLTKSELKLMIRKQACIVSEDPDKAIHALATLIPDPQDRKTALKIAEKVAITGDDMAGESQKVFERIRQALK